MFKQIQAYLVLGGIVLFVIMATSISVLYKNLQKEKDRANREQENVSQLLKEKEARIATLELTTKEFISNMDRRTDSILHELKINPRRVTEVSTITNNYYDTVKIEITPKPVTVDGKTQYPVAVDKDCLKIRGFMTVRDTIPTLTLKEIKWDNTIDIVVYWDRNKFLGLKIGKKVFSTKATADCGEVKIRDIKIVKKE